MDSITSSLKSYYAKTFAEHGANAKGVNWGSEEKAELRHAAMAGLIKHSEKQATILDVGCGYGEFYKYLISKSLNIDYFGIDVVPEMIDYARENISNQKFTCEDILSKDFNYSYDYVVCNGVLTQKLTASDSDMNEFMIMLVDKMFRLAKQGIAFNVMSSYVDYREDQFFYKNPLEIFDLCMKYSRHIVIDHSYPLYEFTTYLYKGNS